MVVLRRFDKLCCTVLSARTRFHTASTHCRLSRFYKAAIHNVKLVHTGHYQEPGIRLSSTQTRQSAVSIAAVRRYANQHSCVPVLSNAL
jgi:hypothetical protein